MNTHNVSTSVSDDPTFGEMLAEAIPLIGAIAGFGPPVLFAAGPWLFLTLMLSAPFAVLLTLIAVMLVAATVPARLERLRAQIAFTSRRGSDAPPLLLEAARRLDPLDAKMARATYLEAIASAMFAGRLGTGLDEREVAEAARASSGAQAPRPTFCSTAS